MKDLNQIIIKIIREQELVVGPLAWSEAAKVSGLEISSDHLVNIVSDDPKLVVDSLVNQYQKLFGNASYEVSREAVAGIIADWTPSDIPSTLLT